MIQKHTLVRIVDNSGGRFGRCIGIPALSSHNAAAWGNFITIVLTIVKTHKPVKRHEIYKALILRTKFKIKRKGVGFLNFDKNCVVLINKKGSPMGKRVYGPLLDEMRHLPIYAKIASLTKLFI